LGNNFQKLLRKLPELATEMPEFPSKKCPKAPPAPMSMPVPAMGKMG